jgi:uncharacterized membrane protein
MATTARRTSRAARAETTPAPTPPPEQGRSLGRPERARHSDALIRGLGWFSIALGVAEFVAPGAVAKLVGMRRVRNPTVIRLLGLREMAGGVGILTAHAPAPWLWARVAGDVMDLALLGVARDDAVDRTRLIGSAVAVAGVTALDTYGSRQARADGTRGVNTPGQIEVRKSVTIGRTPSEIYEFWRNVENLPRFMEYLDSVRVLDERRSSWKAKGPAGSQYEWHAEITEDRPGELIAWRSLPPADGFNMGVVRFVPAPRDQGTEVHVELRYEPPAGALGAVFARLFGREPGQEVMSDLRRLKQVLEMGNVMRSDASVARGPHAARPGAAKGARA